MNDTDRKAAELAARAAKKSESGELPLRVIGYNQTTDDAGEIELFAQRSPLELRHTVVKVHPAILKQIVGAYIALEGAQAFQAVES